MCANIVIDLTAIKLGKVFERMKEEYIIGQPKKDRSRTINLRQVAKKVKITNVKDETVVQRIMTRLFST